MMRYKYKSSRNKGRGGKETKKQLCAKKQSLLQEIPFKKRLTYYRIKLVLEIPCKKQLMYYRLKLVLEISR